MKTKSLFQRMVRIFLMIVMAGGFLAASPKPALASDICVLSAGQVVINEILPAPSPSSSNLEWVELYNTTASSINLSYCYLDDIAGGGSSPFQIAANTIIAPKGFYLMQDISAYFNNTGDDVRLLASDASTILDSFTFGATGYDVSWHRTPDGGPWATTTTNHPTPGTANNPITTLTARSAGAYDGWVLESSETSNVGGTLNSTAQTINLGDDAAKRQYRSILSFITGGLPDNAVITKVTLKVMKQNIIGGGDPVAIFGGFMVDIRKGFFGAAATLQASDFQAAASKSYGPFNNPSVGGWYSIDLTAAKPYVNKLATGSGLTQIRLRFKLDDNNNAVANYLSLYSGNAPAASRPQLIVTYYVP